MPSHIRYRQVFYPTSDIIGSRDDEERLPDTVAVAASGTDGDRGTEVGTHQQPQEPPKPQQQPIPGSFPEGSEGESESETVPHIEFQPTVLDVLVAKAMLRKAIKLPVEIVDLIAEYAEYWPHTSTVVDFSDAKDTTADHWTGSSDTNRFLLRTAPIGFIKGLHSDPKKYTTEPAKPLRLSEEHPLKQIQKWIGSDVGPVEHPCRKIVFTLTSRDQGWGGEAGTRGTYARSWTWFDAGLERIDASGSCGDHCPDHMVTSSAGSSTTPHISPCAMRSVIPAVVEENGRARMGHLLLPPPDKIQCNKVSWREDVTHTVEWRWDDNIHPDSPEAEELDKIGRGKASATGEFVRNLKLGDVVTLWARARFPGWANHVRRAQVDLYWAI